MLLSRCESAPALAEVEAVVKAAIHAWRRSSSPEAAGALHLLAPTDYVTLAVLPRQLAVSIRRGIPPRLHVTELRCGES